MTKKTWIVGILMMMFCLFLAAWTYNAEAVSTDGFVMNVVLDNTPVNEVIGNEVAIPFDSEYKLRLKNDNDRRCTVKITIDGAAVSMLGDIVLRANGEIDLERFLDRSLTEGKRFKFVPLDNPEVDDPGREENGQIVAEFRLEKERQYIIVDEPEYYFPDYDLYDRLRPSDMYLMDSDVSYSSATVNCSCNAMPGATIGGSESHQRFVETNIDVEDKIYRLTLKMVGLQNDRIARR